MSAPASPSGKLGGKHLVDDAAKPVVMQGISKGLHLFRDHGVVKWLVKFYQSEAGSFIGNVLPPALSLAIAAAAKSSEAASFAQDVVVHTALEIKEMADEAGGAEKITDEQFEKAFEEGYSKATLARYLRDPERPRMYHRPSCPDIAKFMEPRTEKGNGKDGRYRVIQPTPLAAVNILEALEGKVMHACPVCIPSLTKALEEDAAATLAREQEEKKKKGDKGHDKKPKSALGRLAEDPATFTLFMAYFNAMPDAGERRRLLKIVGRHLDEDGEVPAIKLLLNDKGAHSDELFVLLKGQDKSELDEFFSYLLDSLTPDDGKSPAKRAVEALKKWDESLTDEVAAAEEWVKEEPKKRSLLKAFFSIF